MIFLVKFRLAVYQNKQNTMVLKSNLLVLLVNTKYILSYFLLDLFFDKKVSSDFMSQSKELEPMGVLTQDKTYKFKFKDFEK